MAAIKVTKDDIDDLEFRANLAYDTLKIVVNESKERQLSAYSAAKVICEEFLGKYLRELIRPTQEPVAICKGGKRGKHIERYILQYVLMSDSIPVGDRKDYPEVEVDENDGMEGLKSLIDMNDDKFASLGVVYRTIQDKAKELRKSGRHDLILKAMDYARANYPKPEL